MRNRPQAIAISGLIAATAIALLVLLIPRGAAQPVPTPAAEEPAPVFETQPEPAPAPQAGRETYLNAEYGFSVEYPETILLTEDKPDMQLSGYVPVCDPDIAIVCFPYPKETYAGTNFESAAFAVHLRSDLEGRSECESAQNGEEPDGEATINGTVYTKFSFGDAATSHRLEGENYRAFRNGRCFELSTRVATTVFEVYEPGAITRFSDDNRSALQAALESMLLSFRFVSGLAP